MKKDREIVSRLAIERLVRRFRKAVEEAQEYGAFTNDTAFCNFPKACCGDICFLLGQFLLEHKISTWRVEGIKNGQTHAWLSTADPEVSDEWIIDITGDQYKNDQEFLKYGRPVYVDATDGFHALFRLNGYYQTTNINELGLTSWQKERLWKLYDSIESFLYNSM